MGARVWRVVVHWVQVVGIILTSGASYLCVVFAKKAMLVKSVILNQMSSPASRTIWEANCATQVEIALEGLVSSSIQKGGKLSLTTADRDGACALNLKRMFSEDW